MKPLKLNQTTVHDGVKVKCVKDNRDDLTSEQVICDACCFYEEGGCKVATRRLFDCRYDQRPDNLGVHFEVVKHTTKSSI